MFPWCKDKPQIVMLWWEGLGRLKWRATGLAVSVSFFSTSPRCSESKVVRQSSPCFAYVDHLTKRAGYAVDEIYGDAYQVISDFSGSIGS